MDVDSKPLSSQDNVKDCMITGVEENVNCTCDCSGSSSKCVSVTTDDIINQTFETSDTAYKLYVHYARCLSRWSTEGIPCSHMFCAMKRVGLQKLPDSLLLKRWSKVAKKYLDESSTGGTTQDKER
ncbi:hypothetical protein Ahy_A06g025996 [Arachis hypogaea]|uniref:Protein FAR1-RELATED SEQUENCE n=1 Tax=Arachis hypogaea TaxID=3818 RepID=A0A445CJ60_ARAHY|nr:hypothetical protein Ahy_A06g025996 [Arachis hypogaea]